MNSEAQQHYNEAKDQLRATLTELVNTLGSLDDQPLHGEDRRAFKDKLDKAHGELFDAFDRQSFTLFEASEGHTSQVS